MIKRKILDNLKKIVIAITCIMTIVSTMPQKVDAMSGLGELVGSAGKKTTSVVSNIVGDFVNLLLAIPDGILHLCDIYLAGNNEPNCYDTCIANPDNYEKSFNWFKALSYTNPIVGAAYGICRCIGIADEDIVAVDDSIDDDFKIYNFYVTPYKIFTSGTYKELDDYYEVNMGIFDINFFSDKEIRSSNDKAIVASNILTPAIGSVYKGLRNLAILLMMLVLVYIGIKILISSISEEQAKYKKMLVDWVVALCLLFIMHYIMSFITNLNSTVINLIKNDEGDNYYICSDTILEDCSEETEMTRERAILPSGTSEKIFDENNGNVINLNESIVYNYIGQISNNSDENENGTFDIKKWGNNGVVKPNAFWIVTPEREKAQLSSIYKLNTMSYVRSIVSSTLGASENVYIAGYNNLNQASSVDKMGYTVLYLVLMIETVMFIIIYIKRVIQLAFLTMIAPIVAFMYPLDKIGDGKAQSFNQWFKDYLFGVLIQPMHLLLYTIFIYAAGQLFQKNLIYAIAIYAYMITAEKYFKKILGFEKASSGAAAGALGGALGAGIAMGGLNKLAGIGPGWHGPKPGGGKDGNDPKNHKIRKIKPNAGGAPASSGVRPNSGGGSSRGQVPSRGTTGGFGNRNRPNASAPNADAQRRVGRFGSAANVIGRRINSALTGGKYTSRAPGYARAVAGNLIGKGIRGGARIVGAVGMGTAGLMAGTASAIVNGRPDDVLKGAIVGAKVGDKWFGAAGNTVTNIGSGIANFGDEINAERAKTNDDVARSLRERDTLIQYQDDLADCTDEDREKYKNTIKQMSAYTDFKSFDDVKAMADTIEIANANGQGNDDEAILNMYKDAKKWNGIETNAQMQDTYKQSIDEEVRQQLGGVGNQEKINELNAQKNEKEKQIKALEMKKKENEIKKQNIENNMSELQRRINSIDPSQYTDETTRKREEKRKEKLEAKLFDMDLKHREVDSNISRIESDHRSATSEFSTIDSNLNEAIRRDEPIEAEKQRRINELIRIDQNFN